MASTTSRPQILLANPGAQYFAHKAEIDEAIATVLRSGWYILGSEVQAFEREFADFIGAKECIGVANGTDAIAIALKACGVQAGDEVITVSHSAVATVAAIEQIGAVPVLCDIDVNTHCLDAEKLEALIGPKTKAVVPVHIYGHPADIAAMQRITSKHKLLLIEDCAQAHGAEINGEKVGSFGDAAAFSFYPTKNLGAIGDGGGVVTKSAQVAEKARMLRQYGWKERYISEVAGLNTRLDELQAAILRIKLKYLAADNIKRREIAAKYNSALDGKNIKAPYIASGVIHAMHLFVIECENRDKLKDFLHEKGIQSGFHYPLAIHSQTAYKGRVKGGDNLPVTDAFYKKLLSLPMYPELKEEEVERIKLALEEWCSKSF